MITMSAPITTPPVVQKVATQVWGISKYANESKLLIGISMLLINIGSKYILMDMSPSYEAYLRNIVLRRLTIFALFFIATKDVLISICLTAAFVVLSSNMFNKDKETKTIGAGAGKSITLTDEEMMNLSDVLEKIKKQ